MRRRGRLIALAVVGLLGVGLAAYVFYETTLCGDCGDPDGPNDVTTLDDAASDDATLSVWDEAAQEIVENGDVSPQTALEVFASVLSPLPGVDPPPWPDGAPRPRSGSGAARLVLAHFDEFTTAQQEVIHEVIFGLSEEPVGVRGLGSSAGASGRGADDHPPIASDATERARAIAGGMAPLLGHELSTTIVVQQGYHELDPADCDGEDCPASAVAAPARVTGDRIDLEDLEWDVDDDVPPDYCKIKVGDSYSHDDPIPDQELAHEVFHCFEFDALGLETRPGWVVEGLATWAEDAYIQPTISNIDGVISDYLFDKDRPDPSVFDFTYTAAAYWIQLHDVLAATDPGGLWPHALDMIAASDGGSSAALAAAHGLGGPRHVSRVPAEATNLRALSYPWTHILWRHLSAERRANDDRRLDLSPGQQTVMHTTVPTGGVVVVRGHGHGMVAWNDFDHALDPKELHGDFRKNFCQPDEENYDVLTVAVTAGAEPGKVEVLDFPLVGTWQARFQRGDPLADWPGSLTIEIERIDQCHYMIDAGALGSFELFVREEGPLISEPVDSLAPCTAVNRSRQIPGFYEVESRIKIDPDPTGREIRTIKRATIVFEQVAERSPDAVQPDTGPQCDDSAVRLGTYRGQHD